MIKLGDPLLEFRRVSIDGDVWGTEVFIEFHHFGAMKGDGPFWVIDIQTKMEELDSVVLVC